MNLPLSLPSPPLWAGERVAEGRERGIRSGSWHQCPCKTETALSVKCNSQTRMTNHETRREIEIRMTKTADPTASRPSTFELRISFVIFHSSFVILFRQAAFRCRLRSQITNPRNSGPTGPEPCPKSKPLRGRSGGGFAGAAEIGRASGRD